MYCKLTLLETLLQFVVLYLQGVISEVSEKYKKKLRFWLRRKCSIIKRQIANGRLMFAIAVNVMVNLSI